MKDFFISYNGKDQRWAEWIAFTLDEAGYETVIQAWDSCAGGDFVMEMQKAAVGTRQTIVVLSDAYVAAEFTQPKWDDAVARDPHGDDRPLVAVRVADCKPRGLLATRVYIDLVGLSEDEARQQLINSINELDLAPLAQSGRVGMPTEHLQRPPQTVPVSFVLTKPSPESIQAVVDVLQEAGIEPTARGNATVSARVRLTDFQGLFGVTPKFIGAAPPSHGNLGRQAGFHCEEKLRLPDQLKPLVSSVCVTPPLDRLSH